MRSKTKFMLSLGCMLLALGIGAQLNGLNLYIIIDGGGGVTLTSLTWDDDADVWRTNIIQHSTISSKDDLTCREQLSWVIPYDNWNTEGKSQLIGDHIEFRLQSGVFINPDNDYYYSSWWSGYTNSYEYVIDKVRVDVAVYEGDNEYVSPSYITLASDYDDAAYFGFSDDGDCDWADEVYEAFMGLAVATLDSYTYNLASVADSLLGFSSVPENQKILGTSGNYRQYGWDRGDAILNIGGSNADSCTIDLIMKTTTVDVDQLEYLKIYVRTYVSLAKRGYTISDGNWAPYYYEDSITNTFYHTFTFQEI